MIEIGKLMNVTIEYDTRYAPISHDLVTTLAILRAFFLVKAQPVSFNVILRMSSGRAVGVEASYPTDYVRKKIREVLVPILSNCRWVDSFALLGEKSELALETSRTVIPTAEQKALRRPGVPEWMITPCTARQLEEVLTGKQVRLQDGFIPSDAALRYAKTRVPSGSVVIHPRCSVFRPEGNTPPSLFARLTERVGKKNVFVVPDFEGLDALAEWRSMGVTLLPEAAASLDLRLGFAMAATLNVIWGSGVSYPLHFSPARFVLFGSLNSASPISSPDHFARKGPELFRPPVWLDESKTYDWTDAVSLDSSHVADVVMSLLSQAALSLVAGR